MKRLLTKIHTIDTSCKTLLSSSRGFTLVEMLAVMVIFVVIGGIVVSILVTTFRTATKTDTLTVVRQNGDYAISQIAKTIRNARSLNAPFPCASSSPIPVSSVTVTTSDDQLVTYSCTGTTIASNGASLLDTSAVVASSCSFACTQASPSDLPVILINLSLTQTSGSTFAEQLASTSAIPFSTSVVIRNINR